MKHNEINTFVSSFLQTHVKKNDIIIDATAGNGHDTYFLSKLASHVYAFDIQKDALTITKTRLDEKNVSNVTLIHDSHEHFLNHVTIFNGAVFNLGYLPGSDKIITTTKETTLNTITLMLNNLDKGFIIISCYIGHDAGIAESEALLSFVSSLDNTYSVSQYQVLNKKNSPFVLVILK
ncbi:MAG TPA: class I SAM-dependent methyltransferase [Acholeplasma sp.]|nr:class I SAM-dependent methyltransferase [Acholeplasma sp.]